MAIQRSSRLYILVLLFVVPNETFAFLALVATLLTEEPPRFYEVAVCKLDRKGCWHLGLKQSTLSIGKSEYFVGKSFVWGNYPTIFVHGECHFLTTEHFDTGVVCSPLFSLFEICMTGEEQVHVLVSLASSGRETVLVSRNVSSPCFISILEQLVDVNYCATDERQFCTRGPADLTPKWTLNWWNRSHKTIAPSLKRV